MLANRAHADLPGGSRPRRRGRRPRRSGCAGFELPGSSLQVALARPPGDHVAAGQERLHLARAARGGPGARRCRSGPRALWPLPASKSAPSACDVHDLVRGGLGGVDEAHRAGCADTRRTICSTGLIGAEHVGYVGERDKAHVAARELRSQLLGGELAVLVDVEVAQLSAARAARDLPGDDVGVVLHLRHQHRIAGNLL